MPSKKFAATARVGPTALTGEQAVRPTFLTAQAMRFLVLVRVYVELGLLFCLERADLSLWSYVEFGSESTLSVVPLCPSLRYFLFLLHAHPMDLLSTSFLIV